jgi:hypothetical protein
VHLVHEEGVAARARQARGAPVVRRHAGRAARRLRRLERARVHELRVQRERRAPAPAAAHGVGDLRGHRPADLGVRHVEVVEAQLLVGVRAEVLERLVRVVRAQHQRHERLRHRERGVVVHAEGARDLLVDEVRAAVHLRAHVLRRVERRRLRRLARDAGGVARREVERREHQHVAARVARAQQRVELDRARGVPRRDREDDRRPDLHVGAHAVDVHRRRAQRLLRQTRAVVEVVHQRLHRRAVLRIDRAHRHRRLRVLVERRRDVLERVPEVQQVLDRREAHVRVLLRDRRPERDVRRDAVRALLDDRDLLEGVLDDREAVEDEDALW